MTMITTASAPRTRVGRVTDTPCSGSCQWAMSDATSCSCSCGGERHGELLWELFQVHRPWYQVLPIQEIKSTGKVDRGAMGAGTMWMLKGHDAVGISRSPGGESVVWDASERGWLTIQWWYPGSHISEPVVASAPMSRLVPLNRMTFEALQKLYCER